MNKQSKIIIIGSAGQLGRELQKTAPDNYQVVALTRNEVDITDAQAVSAVFDFHCTDIVINASAYTAVDKAESDKEQAYLVNESGVANIARACVKHDAYLLHISTDFVFDGLSSSPYQPSDKVNPLGVYGASKLAGEQAIASKIANNSAIIRTAWVYSAEGGNFVKTMLRLMDEKPQLGVIADQIGSPTWAKGLAEVCWQAIANKILGVFHWTDAGVASWYDFAVAIQELAVQKGILNQTIPIAAIATSDYPTPAKRPAYSVLDKANILSVLPEIKNLHWRSQLSGMLDELQQSN